MTTENPKSPPPEKAADKNILLFTPRFVKQKEYWSRKLSGVTGVTRLSFPPAPAAPPAADARESVDIAVPDALCARLMKIGKGSDISLYLILAALLKALVFRFTGAESVTLLSPLYVPGISADTINDRVAVSVAAGPGMTFKHLLPAVKEAAVDAYGNQDYPFEKILEYVLEIEVTGGSYPLSEILCALDNIHDPENIGAVDVPYRFVFHREGERVTGRLDYCPALCGDDYAKHLTGHLLHLSGEILAHLDTPLAEQDLLSGEERDRLLHEFNRTRAEYPVEKTAIQLFEEQALRAPGRTCAVFGSRRLTFGELKGVIHSLARQLRAKGAGPNRPVALFTDPSMELMIGIMAILKAGGAFMPIESEHPGPRIAYMLRDSGSRLLLTRTHLVSRVPTGTGIDVIDLEDPRLYREPGPLDNISRPQDMIYTIYTSGTTGKPKGVPISNRNIVNYTWWFIRAVDLTERDNAILTSSFAYDALYTQFFSAVVTGGELHVIPRETFLFPDRLIRYIKDNRITYIKVTPSLFHIISGSELFRPDMCAGLRFIMIGGEQIRVKDVEKARGLCPDIRFINHYGPTETTIGSAAGFIDFHRFQEYKTAPSIGKPLDNTQVYILDPRFQPVPTGAPGELYIGGDGVGLGYLNRPELTAEKFHAMPPAALRGPLRGERQGAAPPGPPTGGEFQTAPGNGDCYPQQKGDRQENSSLQPQSLPSAASNHDNINNLFPTLLPSYPPTFSLYRTGDLARWLLDGTIEVLGRIDHQVKIRGNRIELGEIQTRLLKHPGVKECVVVVKEEGDKYLCAYFVPLPEADPAATPAQLRTYLRESLPDYMIPSYFVQLAKIPLTKHNKLDYHALPEPAPDAGLYAAPADRTERTLEEIWAEVLELKNPRIGVNKNFFELGGHSLNATILVSRIHKAFNVSVPMMELFQNPTIRGLAQYMKRAGQNRHRDLEPAEAREYYPLSPAQKRMYILQQMEPGGTVYNTCKAVQLEGAVDEEKLERAFRELIRRHESFRTSFTIIDGTPVQRIHPPEDVHFNLETAPGQNVNRSTGGSMWPPKGARRSNADFIRPFDLSRPPLLRAGLFHLGGNRRLLLADMHHIVSDGVSHDLLVRDFTALYRGETPEPLSIQYKDYALWLEGPVAREGLAASETYWLERFPPGRDVPLTQLPLDFPRPPFQDFTGAVLDFALDRETAAALKEMALREGVTLYMLFLAVFNLFLAKITGGGAFIVGTPTAGRGHTDLENIIGMFVNTLALENHVAPGKTLKEFLSQVRDNTLADFEHQDYPFEELVEKTFTRRDPGRNPLFDVLFDFSAGGAGPAPLLPGVNITAPDPEHFPAGSGTSKFDLSLGGVEIPGGIRFSFEYGVKLFKADTLERFSRYFLRIAETFVSNPDLPISRVQVMPPEEQQRVLHEFNRSPGGEPPRPTVTALFEDQVQKTPDAVAVVEAENCALLTYRELDRRARHLVSVLEQKSPGPGHIIAIMPERSIGTITAIMAIWKAGCAYLPMDPGYPDERIRYMAADANTRVLVTPPRFLTRCAEIFSPDPEPVVLITPQSGVQGEPPPGAPRVGAPGGPPEATLDGGAPAYIIYTSGSTGVPKGVMVRHASVANRLWRMREVYRLGPGDVILQQASFSFDVSVCELFRGLVSGSRLCLSPPGGETSPGSQLRTIQTHRVTTADFVPSMLEVFLQYAEHHRAAPALASLRWVFVGVETVPPALVQTFNRLFSHPGRPRLINAYGPTEAVVDVTHFDTSHPSPGTTVPIGKPFANAQIYILDPHANPQPIGTPGQLHISGPCLATGYLNRPELTAEKFHAMPPAALAPCALRGPLPYAGSARGKKAAPPGPPTGGEFHTAAGNGDCYPQQKGDRQENSSLQPQSLPSAASNHDNINNLFPTLLPSYPPTFSLYRTGDLARWLPDGNIAFMGRIDHQVKIRGYRVEPGEIETRLAQHPGVKQAAVLPWNQENNENALCAYIVPTLPGPGTPDDPLTGALRQYLEQNLPPYMVPAYFHLLDQMPLTPGGKIDRRALPSPEKNFSQEVTPPRGETEKRIAALWAHELGLTLGEAGVDHNFFQLGGHSLSAVRLAARIQAELNVDISLAHIFKTPTIRGLARYIDRTRPKTAASPEGPRPVEEKEYYDVSPVQKRLYFLAQTAPDSTAYNMPWSVTLDREPGPEIFETLVRRHQSLRTSFHMHEGRPIQRIHAPEEIDFTIEHYPPAPPPSAPDSPPRPTAYDLLPTAFLRPFDLSRAPLLRVALVAADENSCLLFMDTHHIISDGISHEILVKEFTALTAGQPLAPPTLQYKDYSQWLKQPSRQEQLREQRTYWLEVFSGGVPVLDLPTDYPRPAVRVYDGDTVPFSLSPRLTGRLTAMSLERGLTPYMVFLAAVNILLARLSGAEDIVVGTPVAGRPLPQLEAIVGMFVNTLPMHNFPAGKKELSQFLDEIKTRTLEAFENRDYPYEELVESIPIARDTARNPLFDVMVSWYRSGAGPDSLSASGTLSPPPELDNPISKYDLTVFAVEQGGEIQYHFQYCTRLFKAETIRRFTGYFQSILDAILCGYEGKLSGIPMLSDADLKK